jgi:ribosomal protein S18 acetylase RimI-like enzyme
MLDTRIKIRLATLGDAVTIAIMSRELIETGLTWSWMPQRVRKNIRDRETQTIVACNGSLVVGFAIAKFGEDSAHLSLLAVRQDYQKRGIGRRLIRWLDETALVAGLGSMRLEVRAIKQDARLFYRALGFQEIGLIPFYYQGKEAAVRLMRAIVKPVVPSHG